ncbi:Sec-independent protein translocase protein TatB [Methylonatrum kenyense]|uniref:Sec-independent protein translocase protein TatB n=1 Tax=Methylonatrum kenyense TaxID=455253 RepID=UPI0020BEFA54|nr:Sec-independent protein translocase protein TatB [Methylonatrum kenyense]MCK8515334.1 Sec-independent protein translocase protein TatB [Methylonatrum kenyense]
MFDASFPEIVLILLVALIVVGPERLPRLARTLGAYVGKARSVFNSVRDEVEREVQLDELRKAERDLKRDLDLNQDVMSGGGKRAAGDPASGARRSDTDAGSAKTETEKGPDKDNGSESETRSG